MVTVEFRVSPYSARRMAQHLHKLRVELLSAATQAQKASPMNPVAGIADENAALTVLRLARLFEDVARTHKEDDDA